MSLVPVLVIFNLTIILSVTDIVMGVSSMILLVNLVNVFVRVST